MSNPFNVEFGGYEKQKELAKAFMIGMYYARRADKFYDFSLPGP